MFEALEAGWGLDIVIWLQANGNPFFDALATTLAVLGGTIGYLIVLPLIFWTLDRRLGYWLLVVLVTVLFFLIGGKELFGRPRPYVFAPDLVIPLVDAPGNGFPSGHVGISLAIWGFIALWARRTWGYVLVIVYTLLMAWARMYTGVHYPQDVIGGFIVGLAVAGGIYYGKDALARFWNAIPLYGQVIAIVMAGILMAWLLRADEVGVTNAGILIGGGLGCIATYQTAQFSTEGTLGQRVIRFFAGIALTLLVFLILDFAFEPLQPEAVFRVIRYTLVMLVIVGVYPVLLVRTGFTQPED